MRARLIARIRRGERGGRQQLAELVAHETGYRRRGRESGRVDPALMTTHAFSFDEMERAFEVPDKKLDNVIRPPITF